MNILNEKIEIITTVKDDREAFECFKVLIAIYNDFSGSSKEINALTKIVNAFADRLGINLDFETLYLSENEKTGKDIANINIGSALNCFKSIEGYCTFQKPLRDKNGNKTAYKQICYGCSINNRLKLKYLYDIYNYIIFNTINTNKLINQIKTYIIAKNCNFIRFNETGSFYGESSFLKALEISKALIKKDLILKAFSYTSNVNLFNKYKNNEYLVLSLSKGFKAFDNDFVLNDDCKTLILNSVSVSYYNNNTEKAIKKVRESLIPFLKDDRFVICAGDCSKCSYCKDTNDKRIVVFLRHGNGYEGHLDAYLTQNELFKLIKDRNKDNIKFLYGLMTAE